MTPEQFTAAVVSFRKRALPGRNLYLWCGEKRSLLEILGTESVVKVSALDLPDSEPDAGADRVSRAFERSLDTWFDTVTTESPTYSIAVIHDVAVLAYHKVSLHAIYQRHASDRRMTVLCAEPSPQVSPSLPGVFEYNPQATHRYFRGQLSPDYVVEVASNAASTH